MADLSKTLPPDFKGRGMPPAPAKAAPPAKGGKGKGKAPAAKGKAPPFVKKSGRGK